MEGRGEKQDLVNEHHHHPQHEEMELSLGLSMNGRFGVDPTMDKRLRRSSSSVPNLAAAVSGVAERGVSEFRARLPEFDAPASLWRTRSLPVTEADEEEERRRRKELQSARKKRMEKMRGLRVLRDKEAAGGNGNSVPRRPENGDVNHVMESSQRSGSSGSSDLIEGLKPKQTVEASPSRQQISHEEPAEVGNIKSPKNPMLEMPLVTTKDTGPNGRKVEGFLYGFKKGEEVKIMCVCHGSFLTPKEFAEHGGGGVVEHPLKHIVVNPFPLV